jgi:CRISPR-associated protein Cas1
MIRRIVDIADDNIHLTKERGFMVIKQGDKENKIPLDDIEAVIAHAYILTYSNNLLTELAERGITLVVCGNNHAPTAVLLPISGNYIQSGRMDAQIAAKKPLNKRIWQDIVAAKILNQAAVLAQGNIPNKSLLSLAATVTSGDNNNNEAQAARYYWKALLGNTFSRNQDGDDFCNSALNYGYAVLRAGAARAIVGAGLHPSIGIHHQNKQNPMRLVDDIMEPLRPMVDMHVVTLLSKGAEKVGKEEKKFLASVLYMDIDSENGATPIVNWLEKISINLVHIYMGLKKKLELPILR